jgi:hypothetical protein
VVRLNEIATKLGTALICGVVVASSAAIAPLAMADVQFGSAHVLSRRGHWVSVPRVAIAADGSAAAAWNERGQRGPNRVRVAVRAPGGAFERARVLGRGDVQAVGSGPGGKAVVVWTRWRGFNPEGWELDVAIGTQRGTQFGANR